MDSKSKKIAGIIRRCLSSRYIIRSRNKELFTLLAAHQSELKSHFDKAGIHLIINDAIGIAYLSSDPELDEEIGYKFGRTTNLRALETLALILLRQKRLDYFTGDIDQEMPTIHKRELREFLINFSAEKEDKKFQRKFDDTLQRLLDLQVLLATHDEELLEISPVCEILLPADQISELKTRAGQYFAVTQSERVEEQEAAQ